MNELLQTLRDQNNLRKLTTVRADARYLTHDNRRYVNLSSNDYLGLSADTALQREFLKEIDPAERFLMSNPSSRLMTGNSPEYDRLENTLSTLFGGRSALVLSNGFAINSGVLPALTDKNDLILADKLVHASLIDGLRLGEATWQRFAHNDMAHLERLLIKLRPLYRNVWVVTESIFSMDGDCAPLSQLVALKRKYDLNLYLDEAHAFGVRSSDGTGMAREMGFDTEIDVLIATLGKAMASCGGFIITDAETREVLVNRMRTLIFSTALPPINLLWSDFLLRRLPAMNDRRKHLTSLVARFKTQMSPSIVTPTHILPLMAGDNRRALELAARLRENGFWTTAIRYPTVPRGAARIRISLNAALTTEDTDRFIQVWNNIG